MRDVRWDEGLVLLPIRVINTLPPRRLEGVCVCVCVSSANGIRLRKIAAWHLCVKHSKRRRTARRESWGDRVGCRGCPHKALIPREDVEFFWSRRMRWEGRGKRRGRQWMDGGEKNEEEWRSIFRDREQTKLRAIESCACVSPFLKIHSKICPCAYLLLNVSSSWE